MKLEITSRGHTMTDFLQDYVEKRIERLEKYVHGEGEIHVILERDTIGQIVEINMHALHKIMHAREEGEHVRDCIDKAVTKIEAQLRKHKEKITEKRP